MQELDGSGAVIANLLTGPGIDEYLARTDAGGTRSDLTDILGSTVAELDATVTTPPAYTRTTSPGQTTGTGPSGNAFRYTVTPGAKRTAPASTTIGRGTIIRGSPGL